MQAIYNSLSTLSQLQRQLDITGHNLANLDTVGFKRQQSHFASLLTQNYNNQPRPQYEVGRETPQGIRIGVGGFVGSVSNQFTVGQLKKTDRALDVFLPSSRRFFRVTTFEGERLTRDGNLHLSITENEATLVDSKGNVLLGRDGAPIVLPSGASEPRIDKTGTVLATVNGREEAFGRLDIVEVANTAALTNIGENLYRLDGPGAVSVTADDLITGSLETSNVDLAKEMTDLTMNQRAYQLNSRALSMSDQMMGLVTSLRP